MRDRQEGCCEIDRGVAARSTGGSVRDRQEGCCEIACIVAISCAKVARQWKDSIQ